MTPRREGVGGRGTPATDPHQPGAGGPGGPVPAPPMTAAIERLARALGEHLHTSMTQGCHATAPAPRLAYDRDDFGEPIAGTLVMEFDGTLDLIELATVAIGALAAQSE